MDHVDPATTTAPAAGSPCSVQGHMPVAIMNAGVSPQFGLCLACGRRLNPAYTVGAAELAALLASAPSPTNRGITA